MSFDFNKYEILEVKIVKFLAENPENPNLMTKEQLVTYWELMNEQRSLFKLIVDYIRK